MPAKPVFLNDNNEKVNAPTGHSPFNKDILKPFEEKEDVPAPAADGARLCAHELFAVFTADIIRQQTLFTR